MQRPAYIKELIELSRQFPIVALLGPRQVGKTTLAQMYAQQLNTKSPTIHVFDLENPQDLVALEQAQLTLTTEVQRRPDLFPLLRVLVDHPQAKQRWLILGSASRNLLQQSSESLAGRIAYIEVQPFSLMEVAVQPKLWLRGGFPNSFLANSNLASMEWRKQYVKTYLEQDIPNLGIRIAPLNLRRFWMMLAHYHGNILNKEELARALGMNNKQIRYYLDILTHTFMIRQLQPWWENISKRQVKSPKLYFRDSGILHYLLDIADEEQLRCHPKIGASWEGFALEQLLRCLPVEAENCYFWATQQHAELDLLMFYKSKRLGFEFKYSDAPSMTKSLQIAAENLKLDEAYIIYPGTKSYSVAPNVKVCNLETIIKHLG